MKTKPNEICASCNRRYDTHNPKTKQCSNINDTQWLSTAFIKRGPEKFKCYVCDWGDTPLISEDLKYILEWMEADVSGMKKEGEEYSCTITIRYMTRRQINALPEWS